MFEKIRRPSGECASGADIRPPGPGAANVDVRERSARTHGAVESEPADEFRVLLLDLLHGAVDDVGVPEVHLAVAVEVVHAAVAVGVDDQVSRVAVLVPAGVGRALE